MTKQSLQPELGSGALREALERWLKLSESLPCTSQTWDLTKNPAVLSSLHPDCACTGCIFRREIAAALSLSSPIEPARFDYKLLNEAVAKMAGVWNENTGQPAPANQIAIVLEEYGRTLAAQPSQASSEIREVERIAQEMCRLAAEMHHTASGYAYQKLGEYGKQILDALSPSRQGAGGAKWGAEIAARAEFGDLDK